MTGCTYNNARRQVLVSEWRQVAAPTCRRHQLTEVEAFHSTADRRRDSVPPHLHATRTRFNIRSARDRDSIHQRQEYYAVNNMERVTVLCLCLLLQFVNSDEDKIFFPHERESKACQECELKIPLEMALKLNTITDENQLFREFIQSDDVEAPMVKSVFKSVAFGAGSVSDRFGGLDEGEPVERKAFSKPKPAGCVPELRSVSLRESNDPWIYYWPSCTRIEQCGGCCSHKLLSCQPLEVEQLNFQVVVTEYVGNQLQYKGKEIVTREKHTKCKCDCIVKEKDCNALQEYRKGECRCVCKNKDAEAKCMAQSETKHWNSETCSCECLKVFECSTGTTFNEATCSCEDESALKRFGETNEEATTKIPFRRRWPINYLFGNGK